MKFLWGKPVTGLPHSAIMILFSVFGVLQLFCPTGGVGWPIFWGQDSHVNRQTDGNKGADSPTGRGPLHATTSETQDSKKKKYISTTHKVLSTLEAVNKSDVQ